LNALAPVGWVALGGALGAVARFKLAAWVLHAFASAPRFPWPTFVVNVVGCLAAGFLAGQVARHDAFGPNVRLFLFTGILGGFTTFSAFGLETAMLVKRGELGIALAYVTSSVALGLLAFWLGSGGALAPERH
jgi:fluoride exporter